MAATVATGRCSDYTKFDVMALRLDDCEQTGSTRSSGVTIL
ncbi:hypothetical protein SFRURICE_011858 [Spodoptera frugiperda]|uniref:SFRICE_029622 n=1 Tax=Spodoptera frugiperda TaxID=7108 RepID=A0A2H1VT39_SPOFR|nr:hypothetical protein SFRURICE_011858 [Spodoptera frugiperda]